MKPEVQCLLEYYTGEDFFSVPDCEAVCQSGGPIERPVTQGLDLGIHEIRLENLTSNATPNLGIHGELNAHQRQYIRDISSNLRNVADSLHIRPGVRVAAEQVIRHENLDRSEMRVINNIYSIRGVTTVSRIANYLEEKLTPRTLRAAFRFLCYSVSSVPEELAVVCELSRLTVSKIQQLARRDSTVHDVISEFVEERLLQMQ